MHVAVVTNDVLKKELMQPGNTEAVEFTFVDDPQFIQQADAYIDLLYDGSDERRQKWMGINYPLLIVSAVESPREECPPAAVRINAWPGFLQRKLVEASASSKEGQEKTEKVFAALNRKVEWLADVPGFITARVVSMIINEAFFAIGEKLSSKEDIDKAMKLGTNYPYGPFEWAEMIGRKKVYKLLSVLYKSEERYMPSELLSEGNS
jgi:3-hydroxybutyryl-CoA dehydrogenase